MHIIEQFNGGVYDTIIASDEKFMDPNEDGSTTQDKNQSKTKK